MKNAALNTNPTPDDEQVLCTVCLLANPPRADYCAKCGAPINTLLTFAPYDQILLEGFAYRRAVDGPPSRIILIGMWLLFGPVLLVAPFVVASDAQRNPAQGGIDRVADHLFWVVYFFVAAAILYRTSANYFSQRRIQ